MKKPETLMFPQREGDSLTTSTGKYGKYLNGKTETVYRGSQNRTLWYMLNRGAPLQKSYRRPCRSMGRTLRRAKR